MQIAKAKENVPFVENFYQCGFQDFEFEHQYDLIWLHWFLMYLTDTDLISILVKCRENMKMKDGKRGMIFVKENVVED